MLLNKKHNKNMLFGGKTPNTENFNQVDAPSLKEN